MSGPAGVQGPPAERHLCAVKDPDPRNARPPERALRPRVFSLDFDWVESRARRTEAIFMEFRGPKALLNLHRGRQYGPFVLQSRGRGRGDPLERCLDESADRRHSDY